MRKVLFWIHLTVGCIGGIVILIMSLTGVLLMYEKQIVEWVDLREYRVSPHSAGGALAPRLPLEAVIANVRKEKSALPSTVVVRNDPTAPVEAAFGRESSMYADPYSGRVLGEGSRRVREFFRATTDWHRWLAMTDEQRETGRAITGACNLGFLFIVISGIYLWLPRKWTRLNVRSVTWFRRGLPGKARDFNWHNVFGFWSAIPLLFIVLGGVIISFPWASDLVYRAAGSEPPPRRTGPPGARPESERGQSGRSGGGGRDGSPRERQGSVPSREGRASPASPQADLKLDGLNSIWTEVEQQVPGWRSISLRLPSSNRAPIVATINQGTAGQPQKRTTLTVARETGKILRSESFADMEPGQRLRSWFRFVHTGEYYGIAGQTVAGIASAGGAMLVWTGISLALRRFWAWRKRRGKPSAASGSTPGTALDDAPAEIGAGSGL